MRNPSFSIWILVGPFIGIWFIFWLVPMMLGIEISLQDPVFRPSMAGDTGNNFGTSYVGTENFERVANDPKFWKSLENSLFYVIGSILIILPLSFFLAMNLKEIHRVPRGLLVFCLLVPGLALPGVLSTLFYLFFHGRNGILNQFLVIPLGMEPINWMMDPKFIMPSLILQSVWRWTGMITLFFLCGLEAVPKWQIETARLEGAGAWMRISWVWIPCIRHLGVFAAVFLAVDGFASFSGAYVLLGGSGGMLDSGLLLVTYLYQVAFPGGGGRFDFPAAAAMSLIAFPFAAALSYALLRIRSSASSSK